MTERRVLQANQAISQAFGEGGDEEKRQAAEFLSGQVYALCEERRQNLADNERLCAENSELQRLNIALRCDIEKYQ